MEHQKGISEMRITIPVPVMTAAAMCEVDLKAVA